MSTYYALVIDDDDDIADWLAAVLSANGIQVMKTKTAEEGLEMLDLRSFDLIFIDIFMPGMGGIAGIEMVRDRKTEAVIIAMSAGYDGMAVDDTLTAAQKIGADAVLSKPMTIQGVEGVLRRSGLIDPVN